MPITIGLAGAYGSGKSSVAAILEEGGAKVLDCDKVAHKTYEPGGPAFQPLLETFGQQIIGSDGCVDRRALGALVFADEESKHQLESIVWPAARAMAQQWRDEQLAAGAQVVVIEAAELLRAGWAADADLVWCVHSSEAKAAERLAAARQATTPEVLDRVRGVRASADPAASRLARAQVCIGNDGSKAELCYAAEKALQWSQARVSGTAAGGAGEEGSQPAQLCLGVWDELDSLPAGLRPAHGQQATIVQVDADDRVVGFVPRPKMRAETLWHRASFVFVRGPRGVLLCHQRLHTKDYCPSYWDTNVGGVVDQGEEDDIDGSAVRETGEEVGVAAVIPPGFGCDTAGTGQPDAVFAYPPPDGDDASIGQTHNMRFAFKMPYCSQHTRVWAYVYELVLPSTAERLVPQPDEVAQVRWMEASVPETQAAAGLDWTPDGVAVLQAYLRWSAQHGWDAQLRPDARGRGHTKPAVVAAAARGGSAWKYVTLALVVAAVAAGVAYARDPDVGKKVVHQGKLAVCEVAKTTVRALRAIRAQLDV